MRLIDADKLILHLNDYALGEAPDERESAGERRISKATYNTIQNCIKAVENQKTELDIDEMTERLEDYLFEKYCIEGDSEIWEIIKDSGVDGTAWIPVTERLPKDEKMCLVTLEKTAGIPEKLMSVANYLVFPDGGHWNDIKHGFLGWDRYKNGSAGTLMYKVVAWMPLPIKYEREVK